MVVFTGGVAFALHTGQYNIFKFTAPVCDLNTHGAALTRWSTRFGPREGLAVGGTHPFLTPFPDTKAPVGSCDYRAHWGAMRAVFAPLGAPIRIHFFKLFSALFKFRV